MRRRGPPRNWEAADEHVDLLGVSPLVPGVLVELPDPPIELDGVAGDAGKQVTWRGGRGGSPNTRRSTGVRVGHSGVELLGESGALGRVPVAVEGVGEARANDIGVTNARSAPEAAVQHV
eukprot:15321204-Alexandrium_andersonii.AAC.1